MIEQSPSHCRPDPLAALLVAARRYQEFEEVVPLDDLPSLTAEEWKALFCRPPEERLPCGRLGID